MELLRFKKFYMNPNNGQALGVVSREDTASFGKITIVEVATPGLTPMLVPQSPSMDRAGWVEITREAFLDLQGKYTRDAVAKMKKATGKGRLSSWLQKLKKR